MYTVKKIKTFRGHEGEGFNAELYRDGKKISRKINGLLVPVHVVAVEKKEPFAVVFGASAMTRSPRRRARTKRRSDAYSTVASATPGPLAMKT